MYFSTCLSVIGTLKLLMQASAHVSATHISKSKAWTHSLGLLLVSWSYRTIAALRMHARLVSKAIPTQTLLFTGASLFPEKFSINSSILWPVFFFFSLHRQSFCVPPFGYDKSARFLTQLVIYCIKIHVSILKKEALHLGAIHGSKKWPYLWGFFQNVLQQQLATSRHKLLCWRKHAILRTVALQQAQH